MKLSELLSKLKDEEIAAITLSVMGEARDLQKKEAEDEDGKQS